MAEYVTLQEVKDHLRIDGNAADADLSAKIVAAQYRIETYLNGASPFVPEREADGEVKRNADGAIIYTTQILPPLKAAVCILVGMLRRHPSGDENKQFNAAGVLPAEITALAGPFRRPVLV